MDSNLGPGYYSPDKGADAIRSRSPEPNFGNQSSRKEPKIDSSGGPGTYQSYLGSKV